MDGTETSEARRRRRREREMNQNHASNELDEWDECIHIYTYVYTEMLGWEDEFCDLWKMWKGDEGGRRNGEMKERRVKAQE